MCEQAVGEILETLKKNLRDSERSTINTTESEYYDCSSKNDTKHRGQRCQECLPCSYFNFLTLFTQKNNDALVQCKFNVRIELIKKLVF